ncbi:MAG: cupin domain-containing protein, partial [Chloroflexi bacterium]|nr:cupin domain-containing protein [Chloroflexota bacterium]
MAAGTKATPRASTFAIKGPYLSAGRVNIDLARTDLLWLRLKVNAEGGEDVIHAHPIEDHAFIVLEGEATFFDEAVNETKLRRYEGVMLPKGAFYRYLNTGGSNLFPLRVGAKVRPRA